MYRLHPHIPDAPDYRIKEELFLSPQLMLKLGLSNKDNVDRLRSWINTSSFHSPSVSSALPVARTIAPTLQPRREETARAGRQKTPMPQAEPKKPSSPSLDEGPRLRIGPVSLSKGTEPAEGEEPYVDSDAENETEEEDEESESSDESDDSKDMMSAKDPADEYEEDDDEVEGEVRIEMAPTIEDANTVDDMNRYLQGTDRYKNFTVSMNSKKNGKITLNSYTLKKGNNIIIKDTSLPEIKKYIANQLNKPFTPRSQKS